MTEVPLPDETHRQIVSEILGGNAYRDTISALTRQRIDLRDAVLKYQQTVRVISGLRDLVQALAAEVDADATDLPTYDVPGVRVASSPGFFSVLNVDDLVFSCDGELVTSVAGLERLMARTGDNQHVTLEVLRPVKDRGDATDWTVKAVEVPGGRLAADVVDAADTSNDGLISGGKESASLASTDQAKPVSVGPNHMSINKLQFRCRSCGTRLKCSPKHEGRMVKCPRCQSMFPIPNASEFAQTTH